MNHLDQKLVKKITFTLEEISRTIVRIVLLTIVRFVVVQGVVLVLKLNKISSFSFSISKIFLWPRVKYPSLHTNIISLLMELRKLMSWSMEEILIVLSSKNRLVAVDLPPVSLVRSKRATSYCSVKLLRSKICSCEFLKILKKRNTIIEVDIIKY